MFLKKQTRYGKAILVERLLEILNQLPGDALVGVNLVHNLIVFTNDERHLGYIDLAEESYDTFD